MTHSLTLTLVQCAQRVGDLAANADAMLAARAAAMHADIVAFPELQLIGYPPEDLVLKPALIARAAVELDRLAAATGDGGPAMLVGTIEVKKASSTTSSPRSTAAGSSAGRASTSCLITAPSMKSASSPPARCPTRLH